MADNISDISRMIDTYTNQIERYENLSTWFAAFTVLCVLFVIIVVLRIMAKVSSGCGANSRKLYNTALSGMFLIIPSVITLYLYTFAMNMRKVALFRGYLAFLQEQWNALAGCDVMLFDNGVIKEFFSVRKFLVNGMGPFIMAVFLVISAMLGFGMSIYFSGKIEDLRVRKWMRRLVLVLLLVCVLFDVLCVYYLGSNDSVTSSVLDYCRGEITNGH